MTFLPIVCSIKDVSLYACNIHEQSSELTTFLSHKSDRNLLGSELLSMVMNTAHLSKHCTEETLHSDYKCSKKTIFI